MTTTKPDFAKLAADRNKVVAAFDQHSKATGGPAKPPNGVILTCASTLEPEPVSWLWREWLALGKFHVLAGSPGQGKTTLAMSFAATVSSGGRWPDGSRSVPGNVLIWSGEDDPKDTLLPRLVAMGADPARVFFVTGSRVNGEVLPFDPARDMVQLAAQAEQCGGARLLVVDPVVSAVAGDGHNNNDVRRALQPLVDLGASLGMAVLGISHFSKGSSNRDPTERVVGSLAFGAVARVVLCAAKVKGNEDEGDRRILARSKSNIGPDDGGFQYAIEQTELAKWPGVVASLIEWGVAIEGTARELLAEAEADQGTTDDERSALDDACEFLRSELQAGPKPAKKLFSEGRDAGHSERTINRAKRLIGVESRRVGGSWLWGLSEGKEAKIAKDAKDSEPENVGNVGNLGTDGEAF